MWLRVTSKVRLLVLVLALWSPSVWAQHVTITISNATGFQLNNIGMLTSPTTGFVATVPYSTSLTAGGFISAFQWDTYAGGAYYFFGAYPPGGSTYGQVYVNGAYAGGYGGAPSVTLSLGNTYAIVIYPSGYTPPAAPTSWTNQGCLTLNNPTGNIQYYQWGIITPYGSNVYFHGCDGGLGYATPYGSGSGVDSGDPNDWYALYPNQTVTVCGSWVGSNNGNAYMAAFMAPASLQPCGMLQGVLSGNQGTSCQDLCKDGGMVLGHDNSLNSPDYATLMSQTSTPAVQPFTNGVGAGPQNNGNVGTNGINWLSPGTGLLTEISGQQGFATLNADLQTLNNNAGLNAAGIVAAIRSNNPNIILSNLLFSNTVNISNIHDYAVESNTAAAIDTNLALGRWSVASNALMAAAAAGLSSLSNLVGSGVSGGSNAMVSEYVTVSNALAVPAADAGQDGWDFAVGNKTLSLRYSLLPSSVTGVFSAIRAVIMLLVFVWLWKSLLVDTYSAIRAVLSQGQIKGSEQIAEILGTGGNVSLPTKLVYFAIFCVFVFYGLPSLLTAWAGSVATSIGGGTVAGAVVALVNNSYVAILYNWCDHVVPISFTSQEILYYWFYSLCVLPWTEFFMRGVVAATGD